MAVRGSIFRAHAHDVVGAGRSAELADFVRFGNGVERPFDTVENLANFGSDDLSVSQGFRAHFGIACVAKIEGAVADSGETGQGGHQRERQQPVGQ